jgi:glycosyltransferase involved in cell wall biosynthesis
VIDVSVVIPTCDRPARLLALLENLERSIHPIREVIVVDSGDECVEPARLTAFPHLTVTYLRERRSVCAQRNVGIRRARGTWIFLCDDDMEVPSDYVARLDAHIAAHPECGAASGRWLERRAGGEWTADQPEKSPLVLLWKYLFELGVWGEIQCGSRPPRALASWLERRYRARGNCISQAGWPVITQAGGAFYRTPVFSLGASVVRRDWLLASPYDETLDSHGIGDNYGVAIGFPPEGIHVVNDAYVHHHRSEANRLAAAAAHRKRILALDYFIRTRPELRQLVSERRLLWSLVGNGILHAVSGRGALARETLAAFVEIVRQRNPYLERRGTRR